MREHLTVSIGRATELTGLKDTQIRYFEELYGQERDTSVPCWSNALLFAGRSP
jgi:hypothetical protein